MEKQATIASMPNVAVTGTWQQRQVGSHACLPPCHGKERHDHEKAADDGERHH